MSNATNESPLWGKAFINKSVFFVSMDKDSVYRQKLPSSLRRSVLPPLAVNAKFRNESGCRVIMRRTSEGVRWSPRQAASPERPEHSKHNQQVARNPCIPCHKERNELTSE